MEWAKVRVGSIVDFRDQEKRARVVSLSLSPPIF